MYRYFILIFSLIIGSITFSQVSVMSPYSSNGIGDVSFQGNAYLSGLGGASVALTDSNQTNLYNPATYALTAHQAPLFSFGISHYEKQFKTQGAAPSNGRITSITHLSLVVPFAKRFGLAFGLKPISRVGYEIFGQQTVGSDEILYSYKGGGAIQEALIGFSAVALNSRQHTLSLGVNGKYYFGRIDFERNTYQENTSGVAKGGMDSRSLKANGLGVEIGFNYNYRPNTSHSIRVGGVYRPGLDVGFKKYETRIFYDNINQKNTYDTILSTGPTKGTVYLASKISVGATYSFKPNNEESKRPEKPSFTLAVEYAMQDWSNYSETFDNTSTTGQYINSNSIRAGFEYTPHRLTKDRSGYINIFERMSYRIGGYYVHSPYQVNGIQLIDKAVTAGIGIPIVMNRVVSTIDISGSYGVLGNASQPGVLQENYYSINIGINIAPVFDKWFKQRRLN